MNSAGDFRLLNRGACLIFLFFFPMTIQGVIKTEKKKCWLFLFFSILFIYFYPIVRSLWSGANAASFYSFTSNDRFGSTSQFLSRRSGEAPKGIRYQWPTWRNRRSETKVTGIGVLNEIIWPLYSQWLNLNCTRCTRRTRANVSLLLKQLLTWLQSGWVMLTLDSIECFRYLDLRQTGVLCLPAGANPTKHAILDMVYLSQYKPPGQMIPATLPAGQVMLF